MTDLYFVKYQDETTGELETRPTSVYDPDDLSLLLANISEGVRRGVLGPFTLSVEPIDDAFTVPTGHPGVHDDGTWTPGVSNDGR